MDGTRFRSRYRSRSLSARVVGALLALCATAVTAADWVYSARPGDNIWDLTEIHLKSLGYWKRLQEYNGIEDPRRILPGTKIRMPVRWLKKQPASARIVALRGLVEHTDGEGGRARPAAVGDTLRAGDRITTGADGSATVRFADDSRMLIHADTDVVMDSMSVYGLTGMVDTTMRMHRGRVEHEVTPSQGPGSRYQIITPSAVAAVRGTSFRSAFDDAEQVARGEVEEGALRFSAQGAARRVPAGFGVRAQAGKPPEPPVELLPPPDVGATSTRVNRLSSELTWSAVAGAVAYRAQLFAVGAPELLLLDQRVDRAALVLAAPEDGSYVLRVRGIDSRGLEGLSAEASLTVDARPVPPALLRPAPAAAMHGEPPELWWSIPEGTEAFHVQVSRDEAFEDLLLDRVGLKDSRLRLASEPPPGTYHWRAASAAGGEHGPFSEPQSFRIQAVPPATSATGERADGELRIAWGAAPNSATYQFQLARDDAFEAPMVDASIVETSYSLPEPGPGTYYYRVRGISDEGVAGPFSPVNRLEVPSPPLSPAWLLLLAPLLLLL